MNKVIYPLSLLLMLSSCGQSFNSNTNDLLLIESSSCKDQSNTPLCNANEIIQAKCANCHTGYHSAWLAYDEDDEWINAPDDSLVTPGNANISTLITELKDNGGSMPKNGEELTSEEQQAVRDWINGL